MPLSLRRGTVTAVVEEVEGLVRIEVDGEPCVAYPRLTGAVEVGDEVVVNVQARELELGSGGFDVLYANLTRGLGLEVEPDAHVMTLPYTPLQSAVRLRRGGRRAGGVPGGDAGRLLLAALAGGSGRGRRRRWRSAWHTCSFPAGRCRSRLSDSVRALKARGLVETAVASGACFDGDVQAVGVASALAWSAAQGFDAVVCSVGPGIVGTGSPLGHGGLAAADAANAASALGGSPVLAVRVSYGDERERHRGVSHHTRAVLQMALGERRIAWPAGLDAPDWLTERDEMDVTGWRAACEGLPLEHMGRGPDDDPWFFASAFAAGKLARSLVS